jgi:DNA-binding SARP family transcriptional activator
LSARSRSTVEVDLLGGFELRRAGKIVRLPLSSQRVIAFLAVNGRTLQRSYVAGSLWTESSEEHAGASLRSALWRMHEPLSGLVETTVGGIRLKPTITVDLTSLVGDSQRLGDCQVMHLQSLTKRFDTELLPDWYEDWVLDSRDRWRQVRLHALELLARLLARAGLYGAAVDAGLSAIRAEPLRESAHRTLVEVHLAEGNAGEALRQFRTYERLLRRELRIEPSPRMLGLVQAFDRSAAPDDSASGIDRPSSAPAPTRHGSRLEWRPSVRVRSSR